jgi:UPF0755 protein
MLGITLIALVVGCGGFVALSELRAPAAEDGAPVEIEIEVGDSTSAIATKLSAAGLIRQPVLFSTLVRLRDLDDKLEAGVYVLSPTMTMDEIVVQLQNSQVAEAELVMREGLRLEEIAAIIDRSGVVSGEEFLAAAQDGERFRNNYFLLSSLPEGASLEGYLFPDTYRIAANTTADDIVTLMLDRFAEQFATIERNIQVPNANVHQIVTMASIVQREAALVEEMPQISAVFWNRLLPENAPVVAGRLGADPTVQYALGYSDAEQTWWRRNLTVDDLAIDSPYNTRLREGLPPGPIANPGLAALTAAAQPDSSAPYLFFVADCALDGSHNFAVDFAEFQQYEADYLACS